jgi:hypothetical protein
VYGDATEDNVREAVRRAREHGESSSLRVTRDIDPDGALHLARSLRNASPRPILVFLDRRRGILTIGPH